ncbi:MAG: hypothetical protein ACREH3_00200 [Geminicoccales bacterium]
MIGIDLGARQAVTTADQPNTSRKRCQEPISRQDIKKKVSGTNFPQEEKGEKKVSG